MIFSKYFAPVGGQVSVTGPESRQKVAMARWRSGDTAQYWVDSDAKIHAGYGDLDEMGNFAFPLPDDTKIDGRRAVQIVP